MSDIFVDFEFDIDHLATIYKEGFTKADECLSMVIAMDKRIANHPDRGELTKEELGHLVKRITKAIIYLKEEIKKGN